MKRPWARWALGLLWITVGTGCSDPYDEGLAAKEAGRYKEALAQLRQVPMLSDQYRDAQQHIKELYFLLGKAAYTRKDWDEADEYLKKVDSDNKVYYVEARDLLGQIRFQRGKAAYEQGEWDPAVRLLQAVRTGHSAYPEAQALLKEISESKKKEGAEK